MSPESQVSTRLRTTLLLGAVAYLLFVVYGSLVPLELRPLPLETALSRFRAIPFLQLGVVSRADWMANLLLFMPLMWLWHAALWPERRRPGAGVARAVLSLSLLACAGALAVGIEFTQLYFPQRTVSQNDILAEWLGALTATALWWWRGPAVRAWLASWHDGRSPASLAERLLWTYLAGYFLYNLLPLDLTLSPVEMYHQWREGRVVLLPFSAGPDTLAMRVYEYGTDALLWSPVAFLAVLSGRRSPWRAVLWTVALALLLEALQLFVYSRVSDTTDVLTAALGGAAGSLLAARYAPARAALPPAAASGLLLPALALSAWTGVLLTVFWYPFEFNTEGAWLRPRLAQLLQPPFHAYYFSTEYRAVTSLFQHLLFFAPFGALLAWCRSTIRIEPWQSLFSFLAVAILALLPAVVELGQVPLVVRKPDATDWALATAGALLGFLATLRLLRWSRAQRLAARRAWSVSGIQAGPESPPYTGPQGQRNAGRRTDWAEACASSPPIDAAPCAAGGHPPPVPTRRWLDALALGLAVLLWVPWADAVQAGGLEALPSLLAERLYALYKPTLLWVPLGLVFALGGLGRWLPGVALAAVGLMVAVSLAQAQPLDPAAWRELAGVVLGLWAGHWLGRRLPDTPAAARRPRGSPGRGQPLPPPATTAPPGLEAEPPGRA